MDSDTIRNFEQFSNIKLLQCLQKLVTYIKIKTSVIHYFASRQKMNGTCFLSSAVRPFVIFRISDNFKPIDPVFFQCFLFNS